MVYTCINIVGVRWWLEAPYSEQSPTVGVMYRWIDRYPIQAPPQNKHCDFHANWPSLKYLSKRETAYVILKLFASLHCLHLPSNKCSFSSWENVLLTQFRCNLKLYFALKPLLPEKIKGLKNGRVEQVLWQRKVNISQVWKNARNRKEEEWQQCSMWQPKNTMEDEIRDRDKPEDIWDDFDLECKEEKRKAIKQR